MFCVLFGSSPGWYYFLVLFGWRNRHFLEVPKGVEARAENVFRDSRTRAHLFVLSHVLPTIDRLLALLLREYSGHCVYNPSLFTVVEGYDKRRIV